MACIYTKQFAKSTDMVKVGRGYEIPKDLWNKIVEFIDKKKPVLRGGVQAPFERGSLNINNFMTYVYYYVKEEKDKSLQKEIETYMRAHPEYLKELKSATSELENYKKNQMEFGTKQFANAMEEIRQFAKKEYVYEVGFRFKREVLAKVAEETGKDRTAWKEKQKEVADYLGLDGIDFTTKDKSEAEKWAKKINSKYKNELMEEAKVYPKQVNISIWGY